MVAIIIAATLLHLAGGWLQGGADVPGFRYVLPEKFSGWACVDFGVEGAPPLRREQGLYVIEPTNGADPANLEPPQPARLRRLCRS